MSWAETKGAVVGSWVDVNVPSTVQGHLREIWGGGWGGRDRQAETNGEKDSDKIILYYTRTSETQTDRQTELELEHFMFKRLQFRERDRDRERETETERGRDREKRFFSNKQCMFMSRGGYWTCTKCKFKLKHKIIYDLYHKGSIKHSRVFSVARFIH